MKRKARKRRVTMTFLLKSDETAAEFFARATKKMREDDMLGKSLIEICVRPSVYGTHDISPEDEKEFREMYGKESVAMAREVEVDPQRLELVKAINTQAKDVGKRSVKEKALKKTLNAAKAAKDTDAIVDAHTAFTRAQTATFSAKAKLMDLRKNLKKYDTDKKKAKAEAKAEADRQERQRMREKGVPTQFVKNELEE